MKYRRPLRLVLLGFHSPASVIVLVGLQWVIRMHKAAQPQEGGLANCLPLLQSLPAPEEQRASCKNLFQSHMSERNLRGKENCSLPGRGHGACTENGL